MKCPVSHVLACHSMPHNGEVLKELFASPSLSLYLPYFLPSFCLKADVILLALIQLYL